MKLHYVVGFCKQWGSSSLVFVLCLWYYLSTNASLAHTCLESFFNPGQNSSRFRDEDTLGGLGGVDGKYDMTSIKQRAEIPMSVKTNKGFSKYWA